MVISKSLWQTEVLNVITRWFNLPSDFKKESVMDPEVKIFPSVVRFAIVYAIVLVFVGVITTLIGIDVGFVGSIVALTLAAENVAGRFVKDHQRVPSRRERNRLTWASLAMSLLVSIAPWWSPGSR